jgi:hypothetical protein
VTAIEKRLRAPALRLPVRCFCGKVSDGRRSTACDVPFANSRPVLHHKGCKKKAPCERGLVRRNVERENRIAVTIDV